MDLIALGTLQRLGTKDINERRGGRSPVFIDLSTIPVKDLQADKAAFVEQTLQSIVTIGSTRT